MNEQPDTGDVLDAEEEWIGYINSRLNHATTLLDDIATTIETIQPRNREHAADLLDAAIETLTRLQRRYEPHQPDDDPEIPKNPVTCSSSRKTRQHGRILTALMADF